MKEQQYHQLKEDLLKQISLLSKLNKLLRIEKQALIKSKSSLLTKLTKKKNQLINQVEIFHQKRSELFLPLANDSKMMTSDMIAQFPTSDRKELETLHSELKVLSSNCVKMNAVNGSIIWMNMQSTLRFFQVLQGKNPDTLVYDPQGQLRTSV